MNSKLFAVYFLFLCVELSSLNSQNIDYFEYIYVNSNAGQSSGGHSAIKFGNWVYHFQYYPDKIFHLVRDPWFDFRYTYNVMENRSLLLTKVHPSNGAAKKLERGFNSFFIVQEKHLSNLNLLQREIEFHELLQKHRVQFFKIKSLGYFSENNFNSHAYKSIKEKIELRLGKNYLIKTQNEITNFMLSSNNETWELNTNKITSKSFFSLPELSHEKYERTIQQLSLLTILDKSIGLKKTSLVYFPKTKELQPTESELSRYKFFLSHLEERLIYQLESKDQNTEWAEDCLSTLAIYLVVYQSIQEETFIFLDTLPNNEEKVKWQVENQTLKIAIDSFPLFANFRKEIFDESQDILIQDFIELQDSANRWVEIKQATSLNRAIRNTANRTLPHKEGEAWISIPSIYNSQELNPSIAKLKSDYEKYNSRLREIYPYHLIFQNCTSEIFVKISEIYEKDSVKIQNHLGKDIDPKTSFSFVPFYSSYDVRKNYKAKASSEILSYRRKYVRQREENEKKWWISYQEDFVPSSSIYSYNENDHLFLFFTDDTIILRPIYGFANLSLGLMQTLFGIPFTVFDKGNQFMAGLDGMLFSMPELIFFNIRKGSFYRTSISELEEDFPNYKTEPFRE